MVNLDPQLVSAMVQIIDLAAQKGVFTGNDLSVVGNVRDTLAQELSNLQEGEEVSE